MATAVADPATMDGMAHQIADRLHDRLYGVLRSLLGDGQSAGSNAIRIECGLTDISTSSPDGQRDRVEAFTVDVQDILASQVSTAATAADREPFTDRQPQLANPQSTAVRQDDDDARPPAKRRKAVGGLRVSTGQGNGASACSTVGPRRLESDGRVFPQRQRQASDDPQFQAPSLEKLINGIWESIYSGVRLDPSEAIEQWQTVDDPGHPKLILDPRGDVHDHEALPLTSLGDFSRVSRLARKVSQASRTCRSLEVIVQAYWVQCFDIRVADLSANTTKEKAKKATIAEACMTFHWSEKELRNRMAIWRGYLDIKESGGWVALIFAGMGLYRFCKYRVSFNDETTRVLESLRHRFEVAADTLHPHWRQLLAVVGEPSKRIWHGHPHDWVVMGPHNQPIPLPVTYRQWDTEFSYTHLDGSTIDEEAWGLFDPRSICPVTSPDARTCQVCQERQSEDPVENDCSCFPTLYPPALAKLPPVQVFRTPNGRNNGLLACLAMSRGAAVGEFVGQITSGLSNMDVMIGETDRASYQIWQGRQGNHTRFVNHSCQPNARFERFVWLGTQRIVLVSKGIDAGDEVTVDYSDTYWEVRSVFLKVTCRL